VPAVRALATPEVIEQLPDPDETEYETEPVPEPPDVPKVIPVLRSPETSLIDKAFWVSFANDTVVATDACGS
jgi:hypothetical protein